jgi:hypothetical protein
VPLASGELRLTYDDRDIRLYRAKCDVPLFKMRLDLVLCLPTLGRAATR